MNRTTGDDLLGNDADLGSAEILRAKAPIGNSADEVAEELADLLGQGEEE